MRLKRRKARRADQLNNSWVDNIQKLSKLHAYEVVRSMLERMRELVQADRASLFILDRKKKELWSKIAHDMKEIRVKSNQGIVGAVATSGEYLLIDDAYKDPRFNRRIDAATGYRTRQILCVPIKNQNAEVVGVVQCINKTTGANSIFTIEDLQAVEELAWQTSALLMFKMKQLVKEIESGGEPAEEAEEEHLAATGDGIQQLLRMMQNPKASVQLHASCALGWVCKTEANRERVVKLGGVPVLLDLAYPHPWRSREQLHGVTLALANATMSNTVRQEVANQSGSWKSLLKLLSSSDKEVWFDALRVLANLALHPSLQSQMVAAGVLTHVARFLPLDSDDLQAQAARLLGNVSHCAAVDNAAARAITAPKLVEAAGKACVKATAANEGQGSPSCPDFARAYAKLALVPAYASWLFTPAGTVLLKGLMAYSGASSDDVRAQLSAVIAHCLHDKLNQRIFLEMLSTLDHTDDAFRKLPTKQQRALLLKEKDALSTGRDVRTVINSLLHERQTNQRVLLHYATALETLAQQPSNHRPMLDKSYTQQLVGIANEVGGATQAIALRALALMVEAEGSGGADDLHMQLLRQPMNVAPTLMRAASSTHEPTQIEVCRLVCALGKHPNEAGRLVQSGIASPAGDSLSFLEVMGSLLSSASLDLQVGEEPTIPVGMRGGVGYQRGGGM